MLGQGWTLTQQHWTVEDWRRVEWSDETTINNSELLYKRCKWMHQTLEGLFGPLYQQNNPVLGNGNYKVFACLHCRQKAWSNIRATFPLPMPEHSGFC
jgi:hypothetical protein